MRCADADISLRQSKQSMHTENLSCQPSKKNENKSCNTRSFDYTEAMKETKQTITADPIINPEILALLDRMVKRTDKNIEIMREALKRERKQDEKHIKEINEALKKLTH